ncbi:MAG: ATP-binding protein [Paludibacteraceae bacterium]|nr:ATP-binding protein [Paludibacteraceae bacterium]MBR6105342.1 ATP-binding protein [Paludibacteraceae bacterium]
MLYRKIEQEITTFFQSKPNKILLIDGARQVGKTYIIRRIGKKLFKNFVEINMLQDSKENQVFKNIQNTTDFYIQLSSYGGVRMNNAEDTLVFLDEIQVYPHLLTMLKFLRQDNRYTFVASGSLLGVTLAQTTSIPIGSIHVMQMYPLDFEEFLIANNIGREMIDDMRKHYQSDEGLSTENHNLIMKMFKRYLICGGLPDIVNIYLRTNNIAKLRSQQSEIHRYYGMDASQYDTEHKLKIRRVYDYIPSALENKKKRIVFKDIEEGGKKTFTDYQDEFDYLINAGIALEVKSVSNPRFPLLESARKNLLKLYLNDVGILTCLLYRKNFNAIFNDEESINLGTVYESVVAQELKAHGHSLNYYDNKQNGEVDFLIDDFESLSVLPIEVKSGKDYTKHSALSRLLQNPDYSVKRGIVFSNNQQVKKKGEVTYMPIYYVMFVGQNDMEEQIP